jgi:hypothetical protein
MTWPHFAILASLALFVVALFFAVFSAARRRKGSIASAIRMPSLGQPVSSAARLRSAVEAFENDATDLAYQELQADYVAAHKDEVKAKVQGIFSPKADAPAPK